MLLVGLQAATKEKVQKRCGRTKRAAAFGCTQRREVFLPSRDAEGKAALFLF